MGRKERIRQLVNEAQQRWELLSKRIPAITRDLSLAQDGDSRVVLGERLAALKKERDQVETELGRLERELAHSGSEDKETEASSIAQAPTRLSFEPEMVLIPVGEFLMGDELTRVHLPDYYIAKTPITNAQYERFVRASKHECPEHWESRQIPRGKEHHPVVNVSWNDALAYCNWLSQISGKTYRLPKEQEWEKAARGTDGREYPWGDKPPNISLCNFGMHVGDTTPVGQYSPKGDSPYGVADMAGNVWEWTDSWYGKVKERRVLCGGAFDLSAHDVRCVLRSHYLPSDWFGDLGFRCVLSPG